MNTNVILTAFETSDQVPGPKKRLLLVDDDEPLAAMLSEMMQEWSFVPSTAATLQQARNVVRAEEPFAVIVSDYHLPDGNGLGFLDWLRRTMRIQAPFLLISGGMIRAPSAADDYEFLAKPFRMEDFRSRLEKLGDSKPTPAGSYHMTPAQEAMASVYARSKPDQGK